MTGDSGAGGAGDRSWPDGDLPVRTEAAVPSLPAHHVEAIVAAAEEALSPATRRAYGAAWRGFREWARAQGLEALPAAPETVAAYLAERAGGGASRSTLAMARAAVGHRHQSARLANPCDTPGARTVLRGLGRRTAAEGRTSRQAVGLTAQGLAAIRATAHLPRSGPRGRTEPEAAAEKRGAVDVALASVMRDAMLRRSEAAALRWSDVEFRADGSARVTIRRSKGDQDGMGAVQFVSPGSADALRAIRPPEASEDDRVFGLRTGRAISNRLAAMARAAGLEGKFSGHSPRVGMARDLAGACTELPALMVAGRWRSARDAGALCQRGAGGTRRCGAVLRDGRKRGRNRGVKAGGTDDSYGKPPAPAEGAGEAGGLTERLRGRIPAVLGGCSRARSHTRPTLVLAVSTVGHVHGVGVSGRSPSCTGFLAERAAGVFLRRGTKPDHCLCKEGTLEPGRVLAIGHVHTLTWH